MVSWMCSTGYCEGYNDCLTIIRDKRWLEFAWQNGLGKEHELNNERLEKQFLIATKLVVNQLTKNSCKCSDGGSHVPRSDTVWKYEKA